jgi:hypothetical protein
MIKPVIRGVCAFVAILGLASSILLLSNPAVAAGPLPAPDHYFAAPGTTVSPPAGVFVNDTGVDPSTMTIKVVSPPTRGEVMVLGPGLFRYVTEEIFTGEDVFSYCIVNLSDPLTCLSIDTDVVIDFVSVTAVDDEYLAAVNSPLTVAAPGVLANDGGVVSPMTALFGIATHGTVTERSGGGFTYVPTPGFRGDDSFEYCIVASAGATACESTYATVSIRVGLDGFTLVDDHYQTDLGSALVVPGGHRGAGQRSRSAFHRPHHDDDSAARHGGSVRFERRIYVHAGRRLRGA